MTLSDIQIDLPTVLEQESKLQFRKFSHEDALRLVNEIVVTVATNYEKTVTIHIEYEGLVIAHYLMKGRKDSNWVARKIKTVSESGHSSLLVWLQRESNSIYHQWEQDSSYAVCGGGFPILEGGRVKGAIIVSGLEHHEDHRVIVAALEKIINT